jgi:glycoprotein 2-beta-D-xylosyltransferase
VATVGWMLISFRIPASSSPQLLQLQRPQQQSTRQLLQEQQHDYVSTKDMFKLSSVESNQDHNNVDKNSETDNSNNNNKKLELPSWLHRGDPAQSVWSWSSIHENQGKTRASDPKSESDLMGRACKDFDHSIKRPKHGCEVNKDTLAVFCNFENLRIDTTKINVARGGEVLSTVMGREEDDELPTYDRGAFTVPVKPTYDVPPENRLGLHYLEKVLNSMRYPTEKNKFTVDLSCQTTLPGTTLLTTRYEYVNLYHTMTDWWNAYSVMPETFYDKPHRVIFLDGHAQGNLDSTWEVLFDETHFIKHLPSGGLCLERAIFIPSGYKSPLYTDFHRDRCPSREMASAFTNFVVKERFHLDTVRPIVGRVVLVDRQPYVSHPRSNPNVVSRMIDNMEELQETIEAIDGVDVQVVRLETMSFQEQVKTIRQAHILIGYHGAALSHLMFMDPTASNVIEFTNDFYDFFEYMAMWTGIPHEFIDSDKGYIGGSTMDEVVRVIRNVVGVRKEVKGLREGSFSTLAF